MKLLELLNLIERDDDLDDMMDKHPEVDMSELVQRVADKTGGTYGQAQAFLTGGDAKGFSKYLDDLVSKHGYEDGATSYEENEAFWKKLGISKTDFEQIIEDEGY